MNVEEVLKNRWVWKAHGRYGWNAVDQYNSLEESTATHSSVDLMATFQDSGTADQVAAAMNKAYEAGIERGQAEALEAVRTLIHGGVVDDNVRDGLLDMLSDHVSTLP